MDDPPDVERLIAGLVSEQESARKYAVFKLQHALADPSFADSFIAGQGLLPLRHAVLNSIGNTQAYALGSLDALLELDAGWDAADGDVIQKAVELAVGHPLVNIVRNALTLLVLVVARPLSSARAQQNEKDGENWGFRAIKPALDQHPQFLESLVQRLSASDHTLCANALQLVNALMRDAVVNGGEHEWPRFIKRLQDLGVIGGVGMLMRGDAASDLHTPLSAAILEFQGLTKVLLRKWKEVRVNVELPEHKRVLKTIHLLSKPVPYHEPTASDDTTGETGGKGARKHHPEKWRRLGFETENPALEFDEMGYLGIMDLVDFARRNEDTFHKLLLEQSVMQPELRCPIARASLSVTLILYEHFEIEEASDIVEPGYRASVHERLEALHASGNPDKVYRPLLLQWGRLHTAAVTAFLRLWKVSGAELPNDFYKIEEVVRIIVERIVGAVTRRTEVGKVEEGLRNVSLETARKWQMDGLEEVYEDAWGPHLGQVREQLHKESLQFMKEQRVRCLLQGAWFPVVGAFGDQVNGGWRYVRLSHNRRHLHHQIFAVRNEGTQPALDELPERVDLNAVSSVDSNVSAAEQQLQQQKGALGQHSNSSAETLRTGTARESLRKTPQPTTNSKITILGNANSKSSSGTNLDEESVLLQLHPQTSSEASEWLDGLLMLLNQQPITADTSRLIDMMVDWGVRLRMLNLKWEDVDWEALESRVKGLSVEEREVPSREGLDEEYWYAQAVA